MGFLSHVTKNNGTSPQNGNLGSSKIVIMDYFHCFLNPEYLLFRHYNSSSNQLVFFQFLLFFNASCNSQIITGLQELEFYKPTSIPRAGKLCLELPEFTSHHGISGRSFYLFCGGGCSQGIPVFQPILAQAVLPSLGLSQGRKSSV